MREHFEALEHTEYGDILKNSPRWSNYMPGWMSVQEWERVLGPSVNNYWHMEHMAELTDHYIERADKLGIPLHEEDADLLRAVAYVHDFAEAIDGDTPDPDKVFDKQAFDQERSSLIKVLGSVTESPEAVADLVLPVMHGRHLLSHVWRAIELVEYYETCKMAERQLDNFDELREELYLSPDRWATLQDSLLTMAEVVLPKVEKQLIDFAWLPVIREYLEEEANEAGNS
jgi:5'-deoxynucleotidase YfbR-like HD superfamily hydrolase